MIVACKPEADTTAPAGNDGCIAPLIDLTGLTDGQVASASSVAYDLNIGLVFALTDAGSVTCATSGAAATSVCYDGVLARIVADATYEDDGTYHTLSNYWGGAGISDATTDNTWDLAPTSATDLTTFDTGT